MAWNKEELAAIYKSNPAAKALVDGLASCNEDGFLGDLFLGSPTYVDTVVKVANCERKAAVAVLSHLARAGCGRFLRGRRSWPTRLDLYYGYDPVAIAREIVGNPPSPPGTDSV